MSHLRHRHALDNNGRVQRHAQLTRDKTDEFQTSFSGPWNIYKII